MHPALESPPRQTALFAAYARRIEKHSGPRGLGGACGTTPRPPAPWSVANTGDKRGPPSFSRPTALARRLSALIQPHTPAFYLPHPHRTSGHSQPATTPAPRPPFRRLNRHCLSSPAATQRARRAVPNGARRCRPRGTGAPRPLGASGARSPPLFPHARLVHAPMRRTPSRETHAGCSPPRARCSSPFSSANAVSPSPPSPSLMLNSNTNLRSLRAPRAGPHPRARPAAS
jgi:hypothetical protein